MRHDACQLTWTVGEATTKKWSQQAAALHQFSCAEKWSAVQNQILNFARFPNDWDGNGSEKPNPAVIETAAKCLEAFKNNDWGAPRLATLLPDGSIAIEWKESGGYVQAEIGLMPFVEMVQFGSSRGIERWSIPLAFKSQHEGHPVWTSNSSTELEGEEAESAGIL